MIKYSNTQIVMQEIPDEVSLALNITNCQNNCVGCHSSILKEDYGYELIYDNLPISITKHFPYITNVLFLGEGNDQETLIKTAKYIKENYNLKTSLYSGRSEVEDVLYNTFDYIKIGPYIEKCGPLNKKQTNQRLYKIKDGIKEDITYKFWK